MKNNNYIDKQIEIWSNNIYDELNKYRLNRCNNEKILFSKNNIYMKETCNNNKCLQYHYAGHKDIAPFKNATEIEINDFVNKKRKIYYEKLLIN